ncbi:ATP-binding protein [Streptomyces sp. BI20]|uniref:ATP-binding protein n=1 Tax=Streptomyces sp. BI20 TaxID=3403460 RepID=UPI003C70B505
MADHQELSFTLPSEPASVPAARRRVLDTLVGWGPAEGGEDGLDTVRLILSELVTNAVQHTLGQSPTFTVTARWERGESLWLGVTDDHPRRPRRLPAAVQQDNGRGMLIIRTLVVEVGGRLAVDPTESGGKTVSVTLPWVADPLRAPAGAVGV